MAMTRAPETFLDQCVAFHVIAVGMAAEDDLDVR
jgi:hypothetical protein